MASPVIPLVAHVDALVAVPLAGLTVQQLQSQITAVAPQLDRLRGWLLLAQAALAEAGDGQVPTSDGGSRSVAGWLAEARRDTPSTCGREVRTATALTHALPLVADAVLQGVLTPLQGQVLSRLVGKIDEQALADSQADLVLVAAPLDPAALGRWVSEQIAVHCEPALDAAAANGRATRYLQTRRDADGALHGRFVLSGEDGEVLLTALEGLARRQGLADDRSAGQRRADALVEVCEQVLRFGELPDHGGARPQISYVLPADWAAGRQAAAACSTCGVRCPEHAGPSFADTVAAGLPGSPAVPAAHACATAAWTGPQTRARVESVLCDARITRVLLDDVGQVTGLDALSDSVTPRQRRALAARDLGCAARGCTRPPAMCDAHHLTARADGGPTALENLVLVCRRHHVLWHLGKLRHRDLHIPWHPEHRLTGARPQGPPGPRDLFGAAS